MIKMSNLKPILEGLGDGLPVETLEAIMAIDEPDEDTMTRSEVDQLLAAKDSEYNERFRKAFFTEATGKEETVIASAEVTLSETSDEGDAPEEEGPTSYEELFVEEKKED